MIKRYKESVAAFFFLLFSVMYLFYERNIDTTLKNGFGGSKFMPRVIGILLLFISVIQLVNSMKKDRVGRKNQEKKSINVKNVVLTFVFFAFYVLALGKLGFFISTFIYLTLQIYILSVGMPKRCLNAVMTALLADIAIYLIFVKVLSMMLPQGIIRF